MKTVLALIAFTNPAWAACNANERTFLACDFPNGKSVEVCTTEDIARYSYGRVGQTPELALSLRFGEGAEALPWNGMGREITEGVRMRNNDVYYEVYGGFDRITGPDETVESSFGGIAIYDLKDNLVARLQCIPETVEFTF